MLIKYFKCTFKSPSIIYSPISALIFYYTLHFLPQARQKCTLCSFNSITPKFMFQFTSPCKLRSVNLCLLETESMKFSPFSGELHMSTPTVKCRGDAVYRTVWSTGRFANKLRTKVWNSPNKNIFWQLKIILDSVCNDFLVDIVSIIKVCFKSYFQAVCINIIRFSSRENP